MVTLELSFKGDSEFSMQTEWWGRLETVEVVLCPVGQVHLSSW